MSAQRTVLVREISYLGTDGEDHIAHAGDKVTVAAAGVEHFDWVHDASPEARHASDVKADAEAAKAAKATPAAKAEPKADAK